MIKHEFKRNKRIQQLSKSGLQIELEGQVYKWVNLLKRSTWSSCQGEYDKKVKVIILSMW